MDFKGISNRLLIWVKSMDFLVLVSFFIIALAYTSQVLFADKDLLAYAEIPYFLSDTQLQIEAMTHHGQFPLWNNYFAMGFPLYAQPTNNLYYPFVMPFVLLFGAEGGLKAMVLFHVFLAGAGFWLFSQVLTSNRYARYYGSILYMLSGAFAMRIVAMGHITLFAPFAWVPIGMFFLDCAVRTKKLRHAVFASVSIFMMAAIGVYFLFYFSLLFGVFTIFKVVKIKRLWKPKLGLDAPNLIILIIIGILTLMLTAVKMLPIFFFNSNAPRQVFGLFGSMSSNDLIPYFIDRSPSYPVTGGGDVGFYGFLGLVPMILVPFSLLHKSRFKYFLFASSIVFALWAIGLYTPFGLAHILPIASSIRAPERALLILTFLFISLSVLGFDWLYENFRDFSRERKFACYALFLSVMFIVGLELVTPLLIGIIIPSNYEGYMLYTGNYFTLYTLGVVLLVSIIIFFLSLKLQNIPIKRYNIFSIFHSKKTLATLIVLFCALNLVVVNMPLFEGDSFKEQSNASDGVAAIIPSSDSEPVWINFTEPIAPFRLNQVTLVKNDLYLTAGLFGSAKAWYRVYKPDWNVSIGGREYVMYDYDFAQYEINDSNHVLIGQFDISIENETVDPDAEPGSLSEFGSSQFTIVKEYYNATIYVYRMNNTLPNAFILRDDNIIPINVTHYSPNKIKVRAPEVRQGDKVVFKGSHYPGWKVSGAGEGFEDAEAYQRMISYNVDKAGNNVEYVFEFSPGDFVLGGTLSILYFPVIALIYYVLKKKRTFSFLVL